MSHRAELERATTARDCITEGVWYNIYIFCLHVAGLVAKYGISNTIVLEIP